MSEAIPESIPTSADPRSKRPIKKRALTPLSAQAASVDALFARPDQDIRIPSNAVGSGLSHISAPPEIVANVQGSSAGAGSGEFHVYKASRRREYERLRAMDEEVRRETEAEIFEREKREREEKDREKTRKNREKRERLKARKNKSEMTAGDVGKFEEKSGKVKPRLPTASKGGEDEDDQSTTTPAIVEQPGLIIHDDD